MNDDRGSAPVVLLKVIRSRWFLVAFSILWIPAFVAVALSGAHWGWKLLATLALAIVAPSLQEIIEDFRAHQRGKRSSD